MPSIYFLDERQIAEIRLALYYAKYCHHGTAGHNSYMLLAGMATAMGFALGADNVALSLSTDWPEIHFPEGAVERLQ